MCPRVDPLSWVYWLGILIAGVIYAITMSKGIAYLKKRRLEKIRGMSVEDNTINFVPPGTEIPK